MKPIPMHVADNKRNSKKKKEHSNSNRNTPLNFLQYFFFITKNKRKTLRMPDYCTHSSQ